MDKFHLNSKLTPRTSTSTAKAILCCLLSMSAVSCGILGDRDDVSDTVDIQDNSKGCLNSFGDKFGTYLKGDLSGDEWKSNWLCVTNALRQFVDFVDASDPKGYTQKDLLSFSKNFLVTDQDISPTMIYYSFQLKKSLVGGTDQIWTKDEIRAMIAMIDLLANETGALQPFLQKLTQKNYTLQDISDFGKAIHTIMDRFADFLGSLEGAGLPLEVLSGFFEEANAQHGLGLPVDKLSFGMKIKKFFLGGSLEDIPPSELAASIRLAGKIAPAGLSLALVDPKTFANQRAYVEFIFDTLKDLRPVLEDSIVVNGNTHTIASIQEILKEIPIRNDDVKVEPLSWDEVFNLSKPFKAFLLGGSTESFSKTEWDSLINLVFDLSPPLLDLVRNYQASSQTTEDLLDAARDGLMLLTPELEKLPSKHGGFITFASIESILDQVPARFVPSDLSASDFDISRIRKAIPAAKLLFVGGDTRYFSESEWAFTLNVTPRWIDLAKESGSIFKATEAVKPIDLLGFARKAQATVNLSFDAQGGSIPLTTFDMLIDVIPDKMLTMPADPVFHIDSYVLDRAVLKKSIRPLVQKILWSKLKLNFDKNALETLLTKLEDWASGLNLLDGIYEYGKLDPTGVTSRQFNDAAKAYSKNFSEVDRARVARLQTIVSSYHPLLEKDDLQITFRPGMLHSKTSIEMIHFSDLAIDHLLKCYATDPTKTKASVSDLNDILKDFIDLMFAVKFVQLESANLGPRRHLEADMFTYGSDGDGFVTRHEGAYYILDLLSGFHLKQKLLKEALPGCYLPKFGRDSIHFLWMSMQCLRDTFWKKNSVVLDHMQGLANYFSSLQVIDKVPLLEDVERATRRCGKSEHPIASYDTDAFIGIFQYIETMFNRFDVDANGLLTLDETLSAYPNFKRVIVATAGFSDVDAEKLFGILDADEMYKAIFTYLVYYQVVPTKTEDIVKLVGWLASKGGKDMSGWRKKFDEKKIDRSAIIKIIRIIGAPTELPKECVDQTKPPEPYWAD